MKQTLKLRTTVSRGATKFLQTSCLVILAGLLVTTISFSAIAAVGDLLGTVTLPGSAGGVGGGMVPVAGGIVYVNPQGFFSDQLGIYAPPPGGNGPATLLATKDLRDAGNNPIQVSTVAWDPTRGVLWGALGNNVYTIQLGDPNVSGVALTTFAFNPNVGGIPTIDGLAYDGERDTLWFSPDVDLNVFELGLGPPSGNPLGQLLSTVTPKNANGVADGLVSGVVVGSQNTLYIGRNGAQEIRRIDKTTGNFISSFAQTIGRAEDLSCDPVTYAPLEAIISKELVLVGTYEAFEVEIGTCPLPGLDEVRVEKDYRFTNVCFEEDNDGDGLFNEDPVNFDPTSGAPIDDDQDGLFNEDDVDCTDGSFTGDPLPIDPISEKFLLEAVVKRNGDISSYNPGQYYAVSTVEVLTDLETLWIEERYANCTVDTGISALNPKVGTGGGNVVVVQVVDDVAFEIANSHSPGVEVTDEMASVHLENVEAGDIFLVYVKFGPGLKGEQLPGDPDNMCTNENAVLTSMDEDAEEVVATAGLIVLEKEK